MITEKDTKPHCRKIDAVMPDGEVRRYDTIKECCKDVNIAVYFVRKALREGHKLNGILFRDSED